MLKTLKSKASSSYNWDTSLSELSGVGPSFASKLKKIQLETMRDAIFHFPLRYEDRTHLLPLRDVKPLPKALIQGKILKTQQHRGKRTWLELVIQEFEQTFSLVLFHFTAKQQIIFERKPYVRCFGEIKFYKNTLVMVHPEIQFLTQLQQPLEETLTPIYPSTQGLHQGYLRKIIHQAVDWAVENVQDVLPDVFLTIGKKIPFARAIDSIHRPKPHEAHLIQEKEHPALQWLCVEEFLAHQLNLKKARSLQNQEMAQPFFDQMTLIASFLKNLPFKLTLAQQRVWTEIKDDLAKNQPMMRLVQGDVGCGTTVIAALASLQVLQNGICVALMAPTEILAEQHYNQFKQWFEPLHVDVVLMCAKTKNKSLCIQKSCFIAIGTHALFQDSVQFPSLGLIIIDEQHRFGVQQRMQLLRKGATYLPHQLIMSATPIPRSLAMTKWADMDISIIDELPPHRTPITTLCVPQSKKTEIIKRVEEICRTRQQVYWVCPLIEESEKLAIQAVTLLFQELKQQLPHHNIGLVHGKMKTEEKEKMMRAVKDGSCQILVATTVIEVGVDVPNATYMIIENAERLGLAQLHQLRGRVGRGTQKSYCLLLFKSPLSFNAKKRLETIRKSQNGFEIAHQDLQLRGTGELLGSKQTGLPTFKALDLGRHANLMETTKKCLDAHYTQLNIAILTDELARRWLGENPLYIKV
ncbi:MAG TPA: ATP-dependent DNA helicase RecG [Gammaproteobacteria bacterium]|nr:ATP-dependent DNA helicase RecG [Gammaproteobacteria bacterium]